MIHSFESILFRGLIKPVSLFVNQFEWFVPFPAAHAESSEAVTEEHHERWAQQHTTCRLDTINIDVSTIFTLAEI